jgi:hypothetical protein
MRNTAWLLVMIAVTSPARGQDVLVWSSGNGQFDTDAVAAWLFASGQFTSVKGVDQDATLPFDYLNSYDRILYFSNAGQTNPDSMGDVLHQFAMTGKRLVIAVFSWANQGSNTLGGDIIELGTSPYVADGFSLYSDVTMQSNNGSAFFAGVNTLTGYYHDDVHVVAGAVSHGTWSDGESLLAVKGQVVGVNLFPGDSKGLGGDYKQLFVNSLTAEIPAPSAMGVLALAGAMAARRRR